jgi:hypothetical protein
LSKKDEKISKENFKALDSVTFNWFYEITPVFTGQENDYCYSMIDISKKFRSGCVFCPDFPQEMLMKKN